jgi:hypothetical protein
VAEVLGLKPSTIMKWVYERKIPFVKFNLKRLNQWLDENSHEPESEDESKSDAKKIKNR